MTQARLSVTLSQELAQALRELAKRRSEDLSRLIETALRESALVEEAIRDVRSRGTAPETKKGRDVEKLLLMARIAGKLWDQRVASGEVRVVGEG